MEGAARHSGEEEEDVAESAAIISSVSLGAFSVARTRPGRETMRDEGSRAAGDARLGGEACGEAPQRRSKAP